ncbi:SMI1/KNR4 family protein [Myxosarcina sp. GI1]|uniref:SMI1/KNR4 family protein n=1 Tax=Myxosarcina sp. GI1 TaxID=1541065 RepID=UPI00155B2B0A|nr:SMI1/KNR4 family protein [Myxosarcina sp. GI1]
MLTSLEVTGGDVLPCEKEIQMLEETVNFTLPAGFKEYCSVFGAGVLGNEFRVYCPCQLDDRFDLLSHANWQLDAFKDAVKHEIEHGSKGYPALDLEQMLWLQDILNNSFPFADNGCAEMFVWHLASFNEKDSSYDIYRIPLDALEESGFVGRDLYKFISEFIYETKINEILPKDNQYQKLDKTFYRVTGNE